MSTELPEIPNYVLHKRIGGGAFAEVWLAEHRHNRRKAAIKILKGTVEAGADAEKLFLREGEVLASFHQPNIVAIYDNAQAGQTAYIVMEYLGGGSLQERMDRRGVEVGEAIGYVVQIAAALDAAHARDIIHRDLKPANIMLRDDTTPVLTDFGAVRMLRRSTIHGRDGGVIGTPQYMSPEQIRGEPLDGRSDLYALGVLFQELLTGRLPFAGTVTEVVVQHLQAPPPPLPAELAVLQPILNRLLAKDRAQRYGSGAEFSEALRRCFLDQAALRRLVRFAPSSAWSSQLRALGFQLDDAQREQVRIEQGQYLQAQRAAPATPAAVPPVAVPPAAVAVGAHVAAAPAAVAVVLAPPPLAIGPGPAAAPLAASGYLLRGLCLGLAALQALGCIIVLLLPQDSYELAGLRQSMALALALQALLHGLLAWLGWRARRLWAALYAGLAVLPALLATAACLARPFEIEQVLSNSLWYGLLDTLRYVESSGLLQLLLLAALLGLVQAAWLLRLDGGRWRRAVAAAAALAAPLLVALDLGRAGWVAAGACGLLLWLLAGLHADARLPVSPAAPGRPRAGAAPAPQPRPLLRAACIGLAAALLLLAIGGPLARANNTIVGVLFLLVALAQATVQGLGLRQAWRARQTGPGLYCLAGLLASAVAAGAVALVLAGVLRPAQTHVVLLAALLLGLLHGVWLLARGGLRWGLVALTLAGVALLLLVLQSGAGNSDWLIGACFALVAAMWLLAAWRVGLPTPASR